MYRGIALNTTKFSVMEASKTFKKSRTTLYDAIKNGVISRDSDGLIDLSELIRAFGNPTGLKSNKGPVHVQKDVHVHVHSEIENMLKQQILLLKTQLDLANQREMNLMKHLGDLTLRIEFKNPEKIEITEQENLNLSIKPVQSPLEIQSSKSIQHTKKSGLFTRVINTIFNGD